MDIRNKSAEYLARTGLNTSTKVTYNSGGIIIRGGSATTDDIIETADRRFVNGSQLTALYNISGINTGDNAVNNLYSSLVGIPSGGTTGQVLVKIDNTDYNVQWVTGGAVVYWRISNLTDQISVVGSATVNLPGTGTYMRAGFQLSTLTTTARNIRMKKIYVETDN